MNLTDSRLPQIGCEKLELSMMSFLDHIRKIYIIEQMQKMKIYKRLSELLGINDEPMLLSVINRKMWVTGTANSFNSIIIPNQMFTHYWFILDLAASQISSFGVIRK